MGSRNRRLRATVALAVLVLLAGCSLGGGTPVDLPSADELRNQTVEAMADVETATFEMRMELTSGNATALSMQGDGAMDLADRRFRLDANVTAFGRSVRVTQYVINDTMYLKSQGQWQTRSVEDQRFFQNTGVTQQTEALQNASVAVTGTDTIDGERAYVVEVNVSRKQIRTLLRRQGAGALPENVDIEELQMTQYVSVDTKRVKRFELTVDMTVQGQPSTMTMSMTFTGYNSDVAIQLPPDAPAG